MELGRRAVGVATWYGGKELWRCVVVVAMWRHGGTELWRRAAGMATWRYGGGGIEASSSGGS